MEVPRSLLVALMFVTILSMGIANILTGLAPIVARMRGVKSDRVLVNWKFILLFIHFNLFWHTLDILKVADWAFVDFLYVIAGPALLFFATSVLLTDESPSDNVDPQAAYFTVSRRFFTMLAMLQVWAIMTDLRLGGGVDGANWSNAALIVITVVLALLQQRTVHAWGTVAAWVVILTSMVLLGAGAFA